MRPAKKRARQETQKDEIFEEIMTWLSVNAEFTTAYEDGKERPCWIIHEGVDVPAIIQLVLDMLESDFGIVVLYKQKNVSHLN